MNRGKYEESHLSASEKAARADLPQGIGLELSPLFDLPDAPWDLLKHLIRYYYVGEYLFQYTQKNFTTPQELNFLDVGCGNGEMRKLIYAYRLPKGYSRKYVGVDGDPLKLARARSYAPAGTFIQGLFPEVLGTVEGKFQAFVCTEVYEHLEEEKGIALLKGMRALALNRSVAIFTVPNSTHSRYRDNPLHLNEVAPSDFVRQVSETGWTVRDWFWLRIPHLQTKWGRVPRSIQGLVSAAIQDPYSHQGNVALYVLEAI